MSRNQIVAVTTTKPNDLVPSSKLLKAIDNCVTSFNKTQDAVNIALEIGQKEGFNPRYIGNMIRERLLAAGFHRNTVARVLPREAKHMEKVRSRSASSTSTFGTKMLPNTTLSPENYQTEALEYYPKSFLIQIIHYLEQKQVVKQVVHEVKEIKNVIEHKNDIRTDANFDVSTKLTSKAYYSPQLDANSPRQICVNECLSILQEKQSLTFEDLIKQACQQNPQIAAYIGDKYLMKHNVKLRPIIQQLLDHDKVKRVNQKPIILSYV